MTLRNRLDKYGQVFIVCDKNVERHLPSLGISCPTFILDACEKNKTIDTAVSICRWLMTLGAERSSILLAFGGGVTSDITGFAASIYKRGIAYANIPTTLLAQIDAGIGGKTGVNLDGMKNMLGTFRQPEFIFSKPEFLTTLPRREFISGSSEMLKTFLLFSASDYRLAVDTLSNIRDGLRPVSGNATLSGLIEKAAGFKRGIVADDPYDNGRRRLLNLGHTYGHAIEWWQNQKSAPSRFSHGEAVAIGIVKAVRISEQRGIAKAGLADAIAEDFRRCGLPTELPCDESELHPAIAQDKKRSDSHPHLVLLSEIALPVID